MNKLKVSEEHISFRLSLGWREDEIYDMKYRFDHWNIDALSPLPALLLILDFFSPVIYHGRKRGLLVIFRVADSSCKKICCRLLNRNIRSCHTLAVLTPEKYSYIPERDFPNLVTNQVQIVGPATRGEKMT